MKSAFITRVAQLMATGITDPAEITNILKPEYEKKGGYVHYHNVQAAIHCARNGWYTEDTAKELKEVQNDTDTD